MAVTVMMGTSANLGLPEYNIVALQKYKDRPKAPYHRKYSIVGKADFDNLVCLRGFPDYGFAVIRQLSGRTSRFQSMKSADGEKTHDRMSMQADKVQPCKPKNGERARRSNHYLSITFWCSPPGEMFLYILPSFMITTKFLAGSAISWMFSNGLPSTRSRSASAPSSITPSLPA